MRIYEQQHGYVFEGQRGNGIHIRFYVHENGHRKQRSRKLCNKNADTPSVDAPSVMALAEQFIARINIANAANDTQPSHRCPLCGYRCRRTITGRFAKQI